MTDLRDRRVAGSLKAFKGPVTNLASVVQVLQKQYLLPFSFCDSRGVERIGFIAGSDAQVVVWHFKLAAFENILTQHFLVLQIEAARFCLVIFIDTLDGANRLLDGSEFEGADCCGW